MKVKNRRGRPVTVDDGRVIPAYGRAEVNSRRPRAARLLASGALKQVSTVPAGAPPAAADPAPEHDSDTEE